jgi:hypothetical protein
MGARAIKKKGVVVDMIMTVEHIPRKQSIKDFMDEGMLSSVASTSFVNRFTIRPMGVESKNLKFPRNTE